MPIPYAFLIRLNIMVYDIYWKMTTIVRLTYRKWKVCQPFRNSDKIPQNLANRRSWTKLLFSLRKEYIRLVVISLNLKYINTLKKLLVTHYTEMLRLSRKQIRSSIKESW